MKIVYTLFFFFLAYSLSGQLESEMTHEGIVFPRLTTTEQLSLTAKTGQFIYNHDSQTLNYLDGGNNWRSLSYNQVSDGDADTYVTAEFIFDEDIIRMDVAGSHGLWIRKNANGQLYFDHGFQSGNLFLGGGGNGLNTDPAIAINNVMVGPGTGFGNISGSSNVGLGAGALGTNQHGTQNVAIGNEALLNGSTMNRSIGIGNRSLWQSTQDDNIAIGTNAMQMATIAARNLAIGNNALSTYQGSGNDETIAIGHNALASLTIGQNNLVIGNNAAQNLISSSGSANTVIGYKALNMTSQAQSNVVIGNLAMEQATVDPISGQGPVFNTVVGDSAMRRSSGKNSVAIGGNALALNQSGTGNVAVGVEAMLGLTTGNRNTAIGFGAMQSASGTGNVAIGDGTGGFYNGNFSVLIGYRSGESASGDNQLHIANSGAKSLISGDFSTDEVNINNILNLTPRSIVPTAPQTGTLYMDDGTNTGGTPTLRVYINSTIGWKDL